MAPERTFSIVKPDGVARNLIGQVYARFEAAGLRIVASKLTQLSKAEAEGFYAVQQARPFFNDLVAYMTSGPVVLQVLEGENAVLKNREIMGATDPKEGCAGHHPRRPGREHRGQYRARLRFGRERGHRDRVLLRPDRDPQPLTARVHEAT